MSLPQEVNHSTDRGRSRTLLILLRRGGSQHRDGTLEARGTRGRRGLRRKDHLGRIVIEELSGWADGLWIHEDENRSTSATLVLVHPDGERTFISAVGANAGLTEEHLPWEELVRAGARAIHLGYALLLPGLDVLRCYAP
jgi:hypothetical protein